jgi:hypothetical protein
MFVRLRLDVPGVFGVPPEDLLHHHRRGLYLYLFLTVGSFDIKFWVDEHRR